MSSYKFTYFNCTWLGEPIRFILSYQGIPFDEVRHDQESFDAVKTEYPVQHLPILEIDDKILFQSTSISRYLANKFGLAGADDDEKVAADIAVDTIIDLRGKLVSLYGLPVEEIRAAAKEILAGHGTVFLTYLNRQVETNDGYLVGGNLSWADLFFSAEYDVFIKYLGADVFDKFPALAKLNETIRAIPNITKWVETRPTGVD